MRRLVLFTSAVIALACASAPEPAPVLDSRSPLERAADDAKVLVFYTIQSLDTAALRAQFATSEGRLDHARGMVNDARLSAVDAEKNAEAAILQGDRIRDAVRGENGQPSRLSNYTRYWELGRAKLDSARIASLAAQVAADSALVCSATSCTAVRARELRRLAQVAAGKAREAESLVRIAIVYLAPR
ncbi:MAG TPA: hypothetical protein VNA89_12440 [Gemmatimonadaceae bacterium]|nr:hypothetical protein [Gemmatimonadaceae bacterium]